MTTQPVVQCSQCVLDSRFPGFRVDEEGVCGHCRQAPPEATDAQLKEQERKFLALLDRERPNNSYDCVLAYSGGKDSTFTMHLLRWRYNLRVLAVTFDNWFQSERAAENIRSVLARLGADHLAVRPDYQLFREAVRVSAQHELYSKKALERATGICTTCLALIRFSCLQVAIEKEVPFVAFGLSPGQAPLSTAVFQSNPAMLRKMQDAILNPLVRHLGDGIRRYFLSERHLQPDRPSPVIINPLAFVRYNEKGLYKVVTGLGWKQPADTDENSTNCRLNGYANQVHLNRHGYHPYAYEIAGLVRRGVITREEGLSRLAVEQEETPVVRAVRQELGL
ncbi:MAG: hypothetical protein M0017_08100 [Desulfobacteraceae bacterium]|nr:hypothetical protein [Desulfobacteraceae bacterium]